MALTGRFTFRRTFTGKILLQVEEDVKAIWPFTRRSPLRRRWRNANLMDLTGPELRTLMDLRSKPQFMTQYEYLAPETPRSLPDGAAASDPSALDGIPVNRAQLLQGTARRARDEALSSPDVSVELQSYNGRIGRA